MNNVRAILLIIYVTIIAIALLMVILFETDTCIPGFAVGHWTVQTEFAITTLTELLTIALIPLALRLFKFAKVDTLLRQQHKQALLHWGVLRLLLLGAPLIGNTALYYAIMNTSFGYMAIITLLCMPFVYPSTGRCKEEAYLNMEDEQA